MLFSPPGGPPREFWLWGVGVGPGGKWRGNGQLQLNVRFIGLSLAFALPRLQPANTDPSRLSGPTFTAALRLHVQLHARFSIRPPKTTREERSPGGLVGGAGGLWYATLIHGNAAALLLWLLLHWANTPNCSLPAGLFSPPAHCLYPHISFRAQERGGSLREPLSKQWRKEAAIFTLFPGEPAFLFFYLSSKLSSWAQSLMSESWINSFKPKGAGHPSPNPPWNVLLEIIKAFPLHTTNIGQSKASSAASSLLFIVLKHPGGGDGCLTWYH